METFEKYLMSEVKLNKMKATDRLKAKKDRKKNKVKLKKQSKLRDRDNKKYDAKVKSCKANVKDGFTCNKKGKKVKSKTRK